MHYFSFGPEINYQQIWDKNMRCDSIVPLHPQRYYGADKERHWTNGGLHY